MSRTVFEAFAAATDLVSLQHIIKAVEKKFRGMARERNLKALELAYEATRLYPRPTRAASAGA